MMRALLLVGFAIGCGSGDAELPYGQCPTRTQDWPVSCTTVVPAGTSCDEPQANDAGTNLPASCYCQDNGFWVCNSCPFYWTPVAPLEGCVPGTGCVINSWEHGCECGCGSDQQWHCSPDTINSRCPGSSIDAGV